MLFRNGGLTMTMAINRGDLLGAGLKLGVSGLLLTSLAPALSSCSQPTEDFPTSTDEFDIWREMRAAMRTSPDHTLPRYRKATQRVMSLGLCK